MRLAVWGGRPRPPILPSLLMATTQITPDNDVVLAEIFIAAPPDRVFQALTDPKQMSQWWGQKGLYRMMEHKADLRPGGKWSGTGVVTGRRRVSGDRSSSPARLYLEPKFCALTEDHGAM